MKRKEFLKAAGLTSAVALAPSITFATQKSSTLTLGLASYTLRTMKLEDVIKTLTRLEIKNVALKSMHMPLEASTDDIKAAAEKIRAAGINLYGAGVIYMK